MMPEFPVFPQLHNRNLVPPHFMKLNEMSHTTDLSHLPLSARAFFPKASKNLLLEGQVHEGNFREKGKST